MSLLDRTVRSDHWWVRVPSAVVFLLGLLWPVWPERPMVLLAPLLASAVLIPLFGRLQDVNLLTDTGWDRGRRRAELERARAGSLPDDPADRRRLRVLLDARHKEKRGSDWLMLIAFLGSAVTVVLRQGGWWGWLGAVWFAGLAAVFFPTLRREKLRDRELVSRLSGAGSEGG